MIFNSYSARTRRIWADIYNREAVGRVGYYQLISGKSEKNNCFSKFSSSPITGNCHLTNLFPLHKTYSENITWPVINARSSWRAKTYWMNRQRAERIVRSKNLLMSVSSKNHITLSGQKVSQCQLSIVHCSAGLAVVVVNLDVAVAEIVLRSLEDLSTTCDERCAVCTGL